MWVVKLGGSLFDDLPALDQWLRGLAEHGRGKVVVVPGGGRFAEAVRDAQRAWGFDDLPAHNMAVLAMAQTAEALRARAPSLRMVDDAAALPSALRAGAVALWRPLDLLRAASDELTNWDVTSDSLAAWLAARIGAAHLWLVKWSAVPPATSFAELAASGYVDRAFAVHAARFEGVVSFAARDGAAACAIELAACARAV